MMCPCEAVLQSILSEIKLISSNTTKVETSNKNLLPVPVSEVRDDTEKDLRPSINFGLTEQQEELKYALSGKKETELDLEKERTKAIIEHAIELQKRAERGSGISSSSTFAGVRGFFGKLEKIIREALPIDKTAKEILAMNQKEQENLQADRIATFGLTRNTDGTGVSDRIQAQRTKSIFNWGRRKEDNPFANLEISEGVNVDTTAITEALQKSIQDNMFKSQTGGWFRNIIGPATLYLGQPSLEKSRAQIEGLNTVMSDIRQKAQQILEDIKDRSTKLRGLEARGDATIDSEGRLVEGTPEANTLAQQLEDSKKELKGVLADAATMNKITRLVHGNVGAVIKLLGFASPELRRDNIILQNLNAGLDKNGKALKFQRRIAEMLNYAFQKMTRHVGQVVSNWLLMLNPLTQIKKAFQDFSSYDVKWQRTMNVIKYNLRRIIRPFMEWLAQQLVNILGIVNAIIKGIGKAFGKDWDLFDQSAANAEKMREELEQAQNISAGFDELHDIGSDNGAQNDLMGDIYTPEWTDLYDTITEKTKSFTEFVTPIFENIGKVIQKCIDNWKIFAGLLAAFAVTKGLLSLLSWGNQFKRNSRRISTCCCRFSNRLAFIHKLESIIRRTTFIRNELR